MGENISIFLKFVLMFFEKLQECFRLVGWTFEADFLLNKNQVKESEIPIEYQ